MVCTGCRKSSTVPNAKTSGTRMAIHTRQVKKRGGATMRSSSASISLKRYEKEPRSSLCGSLGLRRPTSMTPRKLCHIHQYPAPSNSNTGKTGDKPEDKCSTRVDQYTLILSSSSMETLAGNQAGIGYQATICQQKITNNATANVTATPLF